MKKVWLYLKCAESCVDYESARNFVVSIVLFKIQPFLYISFLKKWKIAKWKKDGHCSHTHNWIKNVLFFQTKSGKIILATRYSNIWKKFDDTSHTDRIPDVDTKCTFFTFASGSLECNETQQFWNRHEKL
jgi:hypothetical protein